MKAGECKNNRIINALKFIAVLGIYICVPFIIAFIIKKDRFVCWDFEGTPENWLNFWGVYLGAAIPIIVLFFTIRHNRKENNKILLYNTYTQWINQLKSAIVEVQSSFSQLNLDELFLMMNKNSSKENIIQFQKNIIQLLNTSTNSIRIAMLGHDDETEKEFSKIFEDVRIMYISKIEDMVWFFNFLYSDSTHTISSYKEELSKYINYRKFCGDTNNCLEQISKHYNFEFSLHKEDILRSISNCAEVDLFINQSAVNLIKYEINKANNIICRNSN